MKGRIGIVATGIVGVVVLIALCIWQVQRLEWKEGVIATLEGRLAADPIALPRNPDPSTQEFARVRVEGAFRGEPGAHGFADAPLLVSLRPYGAGYRVIQPFDLTDGRRIMVDRGFIAVAAKNESGAASIATPAPTGALELVGALRWPEEGGEGASFGPNDNVWVARDLEVMADLFGAEPILIVAETPTTVGDWPIAQPLKAVNVRNNHLEYALTWGALALVWAIMTGWLAFGRRRA